MINLKLLGELIEKKGFWDKKLSDFSENEIMDLAECFFSSPDVESVPVNMWEKPTIDKDGYLITPANAHFKYQWWEGWGQSIMDTLKELKAPKKLIESYTPFRNGEKSDGMGIFFKKGPIR